MKIGQKIYVRDIDADNFDILTSGNAVVVAVKTARNVIEEVEEEGAEGAEGAEKVLRDLKRLLLKRLPLSKHEKIPNHWFR